MSIKVTKSNFEAEVLKSEIPVMVDFWAAWCGPCKMFSPIIDAMAEEVGQKAKICKINIDEEPELAEKYGVMSIPTVIVFKGGKAVNSSVGAVNKKALTDMLNI